MGGEEGIGVTTGQPNLYKQDLSKLDASKLTALSREVISRQATINIGTIGHVAHGKSTIVKAISGVQTVRFKNELERNITIKLDAADGCSGELADIAGGVNSRTPTVCKKRRLSPDEDVEAAACAKRPRLFYAQSHDNDNASRRLDTSTLRSSSSSSSSERSRVRRKMFTQQALEVLGGGGGGGGGGDSSGDGSRTHNENNSRDPGSDGRQSDYEESSSDGRSSAREYHVTRPAEDALKLKEARVLLHDVMQNGKFHAGTAVVDDEQRASRRTKQWEVERIVQKDELNNEPLYLIKWKNWGSKYNTWEPLRNLTNCEDMLREFEEERQKLMDQFKTKVNFHPQVSDVKRFLAELRHKHVPIDDASVIVGTAELDDMYREIRRYINGLSHRTRETRIKQQIVRMLLAELRRDQLESLQDWENEMNGITKGKPTIRVENLVDLEEGPQDFYYINNYLPGASVVIPEDPPIGCECVNTCESGKSDCCYAQNGASSLPYTSAGRVRVLPGTPIYECNKRCVCDVSTCPNRVVQRGSNTHLSIFRTNNGRGWGVRTLRVIKKGTFVAQYVGEVISSEEAEKRGKQYDMTGRTYLFDLDYNETDGQCPYTVDAATYGNVTHFINHSCEPNLAVYAIWINCLDPNLPNLALFATRDIKQNEELTFDYTCQTPRGKAQHLLDCEMDADVDVKSRNKIRCKCGAATCRRYLF